MDAASQLAQQIHSLIRNYRKPEKCPAPNIRTMSVDDTEPPKNHAPPPRVAFSLKDKEKRISPDQ